MECGGDNAVRCPLVPDSCDGEHAKPGEKVALRRLRDEKVSLITLVKKKEHDNARTDRMVRVIWQEQGLEGGGAGQAGQNRAKSDGTDQMTR